MSALDDDPYLAELLDLTNDELGDGGTNGSKKAGAALAAATSTSQASALASSAGAAAAGAAAASSSSQASPAKAPSYRSSDTHRETLKLLSQLSPSMAKLPSEPEVRAAFRELFAENADDEDAMDLDRVQRALEEHLDVADLTARASVIEEELARWKEEAEKKSRGGALGLSQSMSQQSLGDDLLSQSQAQGGRKRKRAMVPGGKSELPLTLPKGLTSAAEGSKGGGKGPKSLLVELDERDKNQDLTGDSGAVGRVHVSKKRGMVLDLKGHQYLASMRRCPALLLVSVGEEEAKVEDVVEDLCVLAHLRDHLQTMGGQVVVTQQGANGEGGASDAGGGGSEEEEDYSRFTYGGGDSDADAGKKKKKAVSKKKPAKKSTATAGTAKGGGKGKGAAKGGGGRRASAGSGAKQKKQSGPTKVSLKALKPRGGKQTKTKGSDDDSEEESWSEPDDDSDSNFSV